MNSPAPSLLLPHGEMDLSGRTRIMGVINVTPDSFSDGGDFIDPAAAVAQGVKLASEGADILDVGGESTRPGSDPVSAEEELKRVVPVIEGLVAKTKAVISIDTTKAVVAEAALNAGAVIINDVTAFQADPGMAALAADRRAAVVLMHMLGTPRTMQKNPVYADVVAEVKDFLARRMESVVAAGVDERRVVLDPGIGFGKTPDHNLALVRGLGELAALGRPVLLGASRKTFLGILTGRGNPRDRVLPSVTVHALGAALGADIVRVHDVAPMREALLITDSVMRAGSRP